MDLTPAKKELNRAWRCIERMKSSNSFDEYDEAWSDYLSRIENVFSKIKVAAEHHKRYPSVSSKVNHLRATDELLIYLKQARNSAHHGITDLAKVVSGGVSINPIPKDGVMYISNMTFSSDGKGNIKIFSDEPFNVILHPDRVEATSCRNRGITYNPPSKHLDSQIGSKNPLTMAELGCSFYQRFLDDVEKELANKKTN